MLAAAAEVAQHGLANVVLLGEQEQVRAEAKRLGLNLDACKVRTEPCFLE